MKEKNYEDFLEALGQRESGGDYNKVNTIGYLGKYQMGEAALEEAGYYKANGSTNNQWKGNFTGVNGVYSKKDFLNNPQAQEDAVRKYHKKLWRQLETRKTTDYLGKNIKGIVITPAALIAGSHLLGTSTTDSFVKSNGQKVGHDQYKTSLTEYMTKFNDFTVNTITVSNHKLPQDNFNSTDIFTAKGSHSTGIKALREKTNTDIVNELLKKQDEKIRRYEEKIYQSMLKSSDVSVESPQQVSGQHIKDMLASQKQKLEDFKDRVYMESNIERKFNGIIPKDYKNPELDSDKIFTQEEIDSMNTSQKSKNAKAIKYQKKTIGIPSKAQAAKTARQKGSGIVHVNGYIRNGVEVGDYYRALPRK